MKTLGKHLLAEYYGCDAALLNDEARLSRLLHEAAAAAKVRVIGSIEHRFSPHGVTCVLAIEESHLSIHTWPESGYAAADFFTCGEADPMQAHHHLQTQLRPTHCETLVLSRGNGPEGSSIRRETLGG